MTSAGNFERGLRQQAREAGQPYTRVMRTHDATLDRPSLNRERPLPVLLAHVLLDITRAFRRAGEVAGEQPSLVLWANLLRVIPDEGIPLSELPGAARMSRRAVKAWLGWEKRGWLEVDVAPKSSKIVRLTEVGRAARDRWAESLAGTEQSWTADRPGIEAMRAALEETVAHLDLELPHYPMIYGPSDTRVAGGMAVPARTGSPRVPAHGADWVPVIRTAAGSVGDLPLHALLSQTLMAFTIDYEEAAGLGLAVVGLLGGAMPTGSTPLSALPGALGVNGSGKSALERHGVVRVTEAEHDRVATLTAVGERICNTHERIVARVTDDWRSRHTPDLIDALIASLAEVDRRLGDDLPDHVLVRYASGRGLADVSFAATE